jgi:hypothetical protein
MWWALASAALSVAGSMQSAVSARAEAARSAAYSGYNSEAQLAWGAEQSAMIAQSSMFNAYLVRQQAAYNSKLNAAATEYNIQTLQSTNAYNAQLYGEEIDSLMEQLELDTELLHTDYAKAVGATLANQSASGTIINQDSNADVIIAMKAEEALMNLVLDTNAQTKIAGITNAIAQGEYETTAAIQNLAWEGQLSQLSSMYSADMQAKSTLFSGLADSITANKTAQNRAREIFYQGQQVSASQNAQATSYMASGLTSAGSSLLDSYGNERLAKA